jgi:hypothetical protein
MAANTVKPEFSYRENKDGTFDSICMKCYLTVCGAEAQVQHS